MRFLILERSHMRYLSSTNSSVILAYIIPCIVDFLWYVMIMKIMAMFIIAAWLKKNRQHFPILLSSDILTASVCTG
ncbi:MAG: hypothetical protein FWG22_04090, partial [Prolixibacteraceae bacterium]|nr:hypothetical protein [Prolixibacteraceae bacterium]